MLLQNILLLTLSSTGICHPMLINNYSNVQNYLKFEISTHNLINFSKRDSVDLSLVTSNLYSTSNAYYATFQFGSNKQQLNLIIDTGSSDTWIPSIDNIHCIGNSDNNTPNSITDLLNDVFGNTGDDEQNTNNENENDDIEISIQLTTRDESHNNTMVFSDTYSDDKINCSQYGTFDTSKSTTIHRNDTLFSIEYGDSSYANGEWVQDDMFLNNNSLGMMNFAVVNDTQRGNGILGLGLKKSETTDSIKLFNDREPYEYDNFPIMLAKNGIIKRALYSIFLDIENKSELLLGAIDKGKILGDMYKFPMVKKLGTDSIYGLSITLNSVALVNDVEKKSVKLVEGYFSCLLDTGTTYAVLPMELVTSLIDPLNLQYNRNAKIYFTNCDNLINASLTFEFQGILFNVPTMNFFAKIETINSDDGNNKICGLAASIDYITGGFVLGQSFLNNMYMVVDVEDKIIGLSYAKTNYDDDDTNIEVIEDSIPNIKEPTKSETYDISHMLFSRIASSISDYSLIPKAKATKSVDSVELTYTGFVIPSDTSIQSSTSMTSHSISTVSSIQQQSKHSNTNKGSHISVSVSLLCCVVAVSVVVMML